MERNVHHRVHKSSPVPVPSQIASSQSINPFPGLCGLLHSMLSSGFCGEQLSTSRPTPKLESPLVGCPRLLSHYILEAFSIHNLRTRRGVVTGTHISREESKWIFKTLVFPKTKAGERFWGRVPKLSINFEEVLSRARGNFEEQSKVSEPSVIIINYFVIIHAYCFVLCCVVLYCVTLYCVLLYCIMLYCVVLLYIALCCIVLCCIVLYCIINMYYEYYIILLIMTASRNAIRNKICK
jgi:hypothetical protein